MMVVVVGSVVIRDGLIDEAMKLSLEHVHRSRGEPGCISHSVHQDCENTQRLVFVEEWEDQASLQQHFEVSDSRAFARALTALASDPPKLVIYEAIRTSS